MIKIKSIISIFLILFVIVSFTVIPVSATESNSNVIIDTDSIQDFNSIDFDNTKTAVKISKFIDTFSSLLRFLFIFFLMWVLYKFFNIFF